MWDDCSAPIFSYSHLFSVPIVYSREYSSSSTQRICSLQNRAVRTAELCSLSPPLPSGLTEQCLPRASAQFSSGQDSSLLRKVLVAHLPMPGHRPPPRTAEYSRFSPPPQPTNIPSQISTFSHDVYNPCRDRMGEEPYVMQFSTCSLPGTMLRVQGRTECGPAHRSPQACRRQRGTGWQGSSVPRSGVFPVQPRKATVKMYLPEL